MLVDALRDTASVQTHNHVLELLGAIATVHPDLVLNNVMAVFTFMGSKTVRQDDNYTFAVLEQVRQRVDGGKDQPVGLAQAREQLVRRRQRGFGLRPREGGAEQEEKKRAHGYRLSAVTVWSMLSAVWMVLELAS